tara:strand:+ start:581 stop:907 length:327 start_codon:yes stop_codon:yes gene_type:complete
MKILKDKMALTCKKHGVDLTREDFDKLDDKAILSTYALLNDLIVKGEKKRKELLNLVKEKKEQYDKEISKTLQYKDIVSALKAGKKPADLAVKYGLSKGRISQIKKNK